MEKRLSDTKNGIQNGKFSALKTLGIIYFPANFSIFTAQHLIWLRTTIESIDFVHVDALVDTKDGTVIYDGFFVDYELSQDGGLESISLKDVERRLLLNDNSEQVFNPKERHYKIPGHILVIPAKNIINLNITYYKFVQMTGEDQKTIIGFEMIK